MFSMKILQVPTTGAELSPIKLLRFEAQPVTVTLHLVMMYTTVIIYKKKKNIDSYD